MGCSLRCCVRTRSVSLQFQTDERSRKSCRNNIFAVSWANLQRIALLESGQAHMTKRTAKEYKHHFVCLDARMRAAFCLPPAFFSSLLFSDSCMISAPQGFRPRGLLHVATS